MRITLTWLRMDARRRWQSLTILALLVALATTTVLAAIAGSRRGETAVIRLLQKTLPATLTVLPNQPGFNWDKVRALPEVETLTTFAVAGFAIAGYPVEGQNVSFPFGDTQILRTIERPVVLQGRVLNPARVDEVDVTGEFLQGYGKQVGDTLTLELASPQQIDEGYDPSEDGGHPAGPHVRVRIVGVIRSAWFVDDINGKGGLVPSPALFTQHQANFLGRKHITYVNALVRLKDGEAGLAAFRADLARVTHRRDIDIWDNSTYFDAGYQRVTSFESACLLAFGLAAMVAAIFLLGQSVARYTSASVADLQLLRAPGITPRQTITAASAGPFLAALAGGTLGVAGAIVASRWMPIGAASLFEPDPGVSADWLVLGTGWAALLAATAAGAAASATRAIAADRATRAAHRSAIALRLSRAGLPVPTVIGTRFALESGRGGSAVPARPALLGATVGVLGVLATFTFTAGITDAATHPARFGQTSQLEEFLGLNGHEFAPAGALAAVARDRDVTGVNDSRIAVAYVGQTSITTYTYSPQGGKRLPVVLTVGRMPAGPTEIVLAPLTADELHATVGSVIQLRATAAPERATVTGIGFVPEGPHNGYADGAWITPASFDHLFRGAFVAYKFRIADVSARPGTDLAALAARINKAAAAANHGRPGQFLPTPPPAEIVQIRDVAVLPAALSIFLVLLGIGAVGHALATAVRRRQHELAVLRALGITRWQARLVVVTQASVLALAGLAFGVPLGLALGLRLWRAVTDSTPLAYHTPLAFWALLLIVPAGLLAANLLAIWPSHRAAGLRSGQVLRAE